MTNPKSTATKFEGLNGCVTTAKPPTDVFKYAAASMEYANRHLDPPTNSIAIEDLVAERSKKYGDAHLTTSRIVRLLSESCLLDNILVSNLFFCWLMILNKLVRALADPNYLDNWQDIAGYAELALKELEAKHVN